MAENLIIATWNIASTSKINAVLSILKHRKVDVIAFQEVDLYSPRAEWQGLSAWNARDKGYTLSFFPALCFDHDEDYPKHNYGVAILSNLKVSSSSGFLLGPNIGIPSSSEDEMRTLGACEFLTKGQQKIFFGCTHLAHTKGFSDSYIRHSQAKNISRIVRDYPSNDPSIIAGDFNCDPFSSDLKPLTSMYNFTDDSSNTTYKNRLTNEERRIDFFLFKNCIVSSSTTHWYKEISDHALVISNLTII